jgi:hypothetical protein
MAAELHSHAAVRAIEAANHRPHPPRPILLKRPGPPQTPQYAHVGHFRSCGGNLDCGLWRTPDVYCMNYVSVETEPQSFVDNRCPYPRRIKIDPRTGLPVP